MKDNISFKKIKEDIVNIEHNNEKQAAGDDREEISQQKGFKKSVFGHVMMGYMAVISVFWIILLLVLCLDYYGYVSGLYYQC